MRRANQIKVKSLKKTEAFYNFELRKKDLTEKRRNEFLKAKKIIERIIKEREKAGEKGKHKKIIPHDHKAKAIFQNSKRGY